MLIRILLSIIVLGLLFLTLSQVLEKLDNNYDLHHKIDPNLAFGSPTLPPLPQNHLPISRAAIRPNPAGVPATELQLLSQPAMPALRDVG